MQTFVIGVAAGLLLSVPLTVGVRKLCECVAGPAAKEIADVYLSGPIQHADLQDRGISSMAVVWRGRRVKVQWFSPHAGGGLYEFSIDGNKACGLNGPGISMVLRAAKERAQNRAEELLNDLNGLVGQV